MINFLIGFALGLYIASTGVVGIAKDVEYIVNTAKNVQIKVDPQ